MRLPALLAHAVRRLGRRPMRTLLLLQGTVWGVAVAVFPSAVLEGTREAARTRAAVLGADRVAVAPDPTAPQGSRFDRDDVRAVREALVLRGLAVPDRVAGAEVLGLLEGGRDDLERPAALVAADPGAAEARGLGLAAGRWLVPGDGPQRCVVEADVASWLGLTQVAPGDRLELPGRGAPLEVVGVTRARSSLLRATNDLGFDVTHPLFRQVGRSLLLATGIPLVEDAWKRSDRVVWVLPRSEAVDWIFLRTGGEQVKEAAETAASTLVERGLSPVTLHPLVLPFVLGGEVDRFVAVQRALFLACLAMGAVVMTNLGLLTILRRRREIAIRRVEGATRRDIGLQIVLEGVVLTSVGCAAGCALAIGLAALRVALEPVTGFTWRFPWVDASIAIAVALVVGVLASLLPALRASAQAPVEGLAGD